jgi:ABC-2 type transport system ATP-binding protein
MLELVGLSRWGRTLVRKYSKGMLQRLGLAQALLHDPELLILDEPTDGVDPVGRAEIRDILGRLKSQGKTVFLNSHLLQEVELICDRVAILGRGKLRRMDSVDAITRLTSPEAIFTVRADESMIRRTLNGRSIRRARALDSEHTQIELDALDQAGLDGCIDDFRRAGISIASIMRRQLTLEQAFLDLVQDGAPHR